MISLVLGSLVAFALPSADYLDSFVLRSDQRLEELVKKKWGKSKSQSMAQANAHLALVALRRLQGRDEDAQKILQKCAGICAKWGEKSEWEANRSWICGLGKAGSGITCPKKK